MGILKKLFGILKPEPEQDTTRSADMPSAEKEPSVEKKTATAKKPAADKKPTAAKKPAAEKKPAATKKPAAKKPSAKKPAAAEKMQIHVTSEEDTPQGTQHSHSEAEETISVPEPISEQETSSAGNGVFSARLEAMIAAALQDGILTDKERELLKKRAEKEGEDWDEVEMIIEARLAETESVAPAAPPAKTKKKKAEPKTVVKPVKPVIYAKKVEDKNKKSIVVPKGVTELADNAFWGFGAETIVLPSTLRVLNRESFRNCEQLENITIPEGVEIIPEQCFDGCKSLTNIVLPSTLIKIQGFAFQDCRLLESITIPEGVEIIPEMCFSRCMCLTNIILPSTIKRIDPNAFSLCDNLQSLTIPIGCNKIMICEYAFGFITQHLKRFFLPSTLSSIRCVKSLNSGDLNVYCYSPSLEGMDTLTKDWSDELRLHVLPQFLETYKAQAKAERLTDKLKICPIPDEYLYYYDN